MPKELSGNKKATVTLIIGLVLGLLVASVISNPFASLNVPSGHETVAGKVTLRDTTIGSTYTAVFVDSGATSELAIIPLSFSGSVGWSKWEFRATPTDASTVYAYMMIYGAGSNGEYYVMLSRNSVDAFTGSYPSGTINWMYGGNDGFVYFIYTL